MSGFGLDNIYIGTHATILILNTFVGLIIKDFLHAGY